MATDALAPYVARTSAAMMLTIENVGPSLTWRRILSTCVISMRRFDTKCKYMFLFPLKNLARKGLRNSCEQIRSDKIQCNKILQTSLQELMQNINQRLKPQRTPHSSPTRASCGMSFVNIFEKIDRIVIGIPGEMTASYWNRTLEVTMPSGRKMALMSTQGSCGTNNSFRPASDFWSLLFSSLWSISEW